MGAGEARKGIEMTQDGFMMDSHTAMIFFRWCGIYNILPHDKRRITAMQRLVAKKKAKYFPHFNEPRPNN